MKYRVHFYDKNGDETRSLMVEAPDQEVAEARAEEEADKRGWPSGFRVADSFMLE